MCSKIDHQSYCKEAEEIQVENHSDLLVFFFSHDLRAMNGVGFGSM